MFVMYEFYYWLLVVMEFYGVVVQVVWFQEKCQWYFEYFGYFVWCWYYCGVFGDLCYYWCDVVVVDCFEYVEEVQW